MSDILIVEDSQVQAALMRKRISARFPDINVRLASDPFEAREAIAARSPDLMLLDIDLPKMSGHEFLGYLMRSYPLPVAVVTATVQEGSDRGSKLRELGCLAIINKPIDSQDFARFEQSLFNIIAKTLGRESKEKGSTTFTLTKNSNPRTTAASPIEYEKSIIALGASTGGPSALECVLAGLALDSPPVVVAQHIPLRFAQSLVDTLNSQTLLKVQLAEDGQRMQNGNVYIAPPLLNTRVVPGLRLSMEPADPNCRFMPNVDVLFQSLGELRTYSIAAALLTGMGDDGAKGLLELRRQGAFTIAQDESTCVVYGMPARAVALDAATSVLPLSDIGPALKRWYSSVQVPSSVHSSRSTSFPTMRQSQT